MSTAADIRLLAEQLQTDSVKHANNAVKLLNLIRAHKNEVGPLCDDLDETLPFIY
jgi:hypothetical protein